MSTLVTAPINQYQTPPTSYPLPSSPPPIIPATRKPRPPLESAKTVLSAEVFQRRHALEFAHLHSNADKNDLQAEQAILEQERRIGRMKRQNRAVSTGSTNHIRRSASGRAMSVDAGSGRSGIGRRPLSLISKNANQGHVRSRTADIGLGIEGLKSTSRGGSVIVSKRPLSLRSSMVSPASTGRPNYKPEEQALEVLVERDGSPPPETAFSEGDQSFSSSTYSWATSFSGETNELRTAAQYVHSGAQSPEPEDPASLDSPARKDQRKKRIKAIAHTVRQLEGVGSRDLEDPTFYSVLAKAWYERFDEKQKATLHSPINLPPTPEYGEDGQSGPSGLAMPRLPHLQPGTSDQWASPPDPEFKTPIQGYDAHPAHHEYPQPQSTHTSMRSNSVRYSYASTLHDLALEGMMQGSKLMREKAWLRPMSQIGTPWGGDFDAPPSLRPVTPEEQEETSFASSLDSPFEYDRATRALRHMHMPITRQRVVSDEKAPLESPSKVPDQGEAGPSGWVNAWWDSTPAPSRPTSIRRSSRYGGMMGDFQYGEDGTIPKYQKNQRSSTIQTSTTAALEPNTTPLPTTTVHHPSLSPSDQMFIEALLRVPSRRRSQMTRRSIRQRGSHRRTRSDPAPITLAGKTRRDFIESVYLNHYLPKCMPTHSITSSPLPPAPPPSQQHSEDLQVVTPITPNDPAHNSQLQYLQVAPRPLKETQVQVEADEEDGLTGLDNLSLQSISPLPTPPLPSGPSRSRAIKTCSILLGPPVRPIHPIRDTRGILIEQYDPTRRSILVQDVPDEMAMEEMDESWGTYEFLDPGHLARWVPKPPMNLSVRTSTLAPMPQDDEEVLEEMSETDEDLPHPARRIRSSSLPHNTGRWSSLPGSPDTACPPRLLSPETVSPSDTQSISLSVDMGRSGRPAPHRMSSSNGTPYLSANARRAIRKSRLRYSHYDTEAFTQPEQTETRATSKWMFYFGFIFPLLWLVGSWPMTPENVEDTEKGTRAEYMLKRRIEAMSWWRRWTFHPDPYVERCRWAAGVMVPVCIVAGVVVAVILIIAF